MVCNVENHITSSKINSIIFDLDGTIVDSQQSIIESLRWALKNSGVRPVMDLTTDLIGPPLIETLKKISGQSDELLLRELVESFKSRYDSVGYKSSRPFSGMESALWQLYNMGYELHIATNKRLIAAQNIIKYFSLDKYFKSLYTIDLNCESPFKNKSKMIEGLVRDQSLNPEHTLYIGDRADDYHSARDNNIGCLLVGWGYGVETNELSGLSLVNTPSELHLKISSFI